ncbi:NACHT domain-containing protein [Frigoriglobus tundricola]|uniref:Uncharacterized protein n=1 Tax=Frigoriglobus tundricola TaxID=2774151 RepID=A0A6M5YZY4_9BACT|nr:hypothetical protein [Frigoriglobus tundricola]QJW98502.1 hypothetical protein FTUN_6092 [Frigoriglobus tundricola]
MSRKKSFVCYHTLPADALCLNRPETDLEAFFGRLHVPLGVEELLLGEGAPRACRRDSLTKLLRADDAPPGVLLLGPSGSGKTVAAVKAFRDLQQEADQCGANVLPVWLNAPDLLGVERSWGRFLNCVTAAVSCPAQSFRPTANCVEDWLEYCPHRLVFFADLTGLSETTDGISALAAARDKFQDWGSRDWGSRHTLVLVARDLVLVVRDRGDLSAVFPSYHLCRVCRPNDEERAKFGVLPEEWQEVAEFLDPDWHTPLVFSYLAELAREKGGVGRLTSVTDLYEKITRHQFEIETQIRPRPRAGGLYDQYDSLIPSLIGLMAVLALRLLRERLPNPARRDLLSPFLDTKGWAADLCTLGLNLPSELKSLLPLFPKKNGYQPVDGEYVRRLGLFAATDDHPNYKFVQDSLLDYFAGAVGLYTVFEASPDKGLCWAVTAVRTHPDLWGPALQYLAGRLHRGDFLDLLAGALFDRPPDLPPGGARTDEVSAQLARHVLRGRPWREKDLTRVWQPDENENLRAIQITFQRSSLLVKKWPEVIRSICREQVEPSPRLAEWLEKTTTGLARLERVRAGSPVDAARVLPALTAPLHTGRVVRVLASKGWVYALSAEGRLRAWSPEPGYSAEFPSADNPVAAFDTLPGGGVVVGCRDGAVWLWPPYPPWQPTRLYSHPSPVTAVETWADRKGTVLVGHQNGFVFRVSSIQSPPTKIALCGDHRVPVRRLTRLSDRFDQYAFATSDGTGVKVHDAARPAKDRERVAVHGMGVPLTALLAFPPGGVLIGWKNGRVTRSALDETPEEELSFPAGEQALGPVVGLAVSPKGAWASDLAGRVVPLTGVSTKDITQATATGRLAWRGEELLIGDQSGWLRIVTPEAAVTSSPDRADQAILAVAGRAGTEPGCVHLTSVGRDGRLRFDDVGRDGVTFGPRFHLCAPVAEVRHNPDGSISVRVAGTEPGNGDRYPNLADDNTPVTRGLWLTWAGGHLCGADYKLMPRAGGSQPHRIVARHVGDVCTTAGELSEDQPLATGGSDQVVAVWGHNVPDCNTTAEAAYFAPASVSAVAWAGAEYLCVGLATGESLVLRYTPPAQGASRGDAPPGRN